MNRTSSWIAAGLAAITLAVVPVAALTRWRRADGQARRVDWHAEEDGIHQLHSMLHLT
jgi:hypothetical protein